MPNTRASKNKISGSELLSDSDADFYQIPPPAFATAKKSPTTILTRSTKRFKSTPSVPQTKATYDTSTLDNLELEMVTFHAIKSQLTINACVKSSKNKLTQLALLCPSPLTFRNQTSTKNQKRGQK